MRTAYLDTLFQLAGKDENVLALISDNGAIVYDEYRAAFPNQFLNAGISEAHMLGMAAGLASRGKIPFAYTIGPFLAYRALEFIRLDICYQNENVKIVGTGAGMSYSSLGMTHHATEDLGALRSLPNLLILSPASPMEVRKATIAAYEYPGPVYLRIGTNKEREIYAQDYDFQIGKPVILKRGGDLCMIGTGSVLSDILEAAWELEKTGIDAQVINIHTIKPIEEDIIVQAAKETGRLLTVEDHNRTGGIGSAVAEIIAEAGVGVKFRRIGLSDYSHGYGSYVELKEKNGIGIKSIKRAAIQICSDS